MTDEPVVRSDPNWAYEPEWLRAASLSPDKILGICEEWQEEALARTHEQPCMNDDEWGNLCEMMRVVTYNHDGDAQKIMDFEQALLGESSEEALVKCRAAWPIVEVVASRAKAGISRRISEHRIQRMPSPEVAAAPATMVSRHMFETPASTSPNADENSESRSLATPKHKKNTEKGEALAKIIAALTKHHKYAEGGNLNKEPIGCNEIARLADVSTGTASKFFKDKFGGHHHYKVICANETNLEASLKLINSEFLPKMLVSTDRLPELSMPNEEAEKADE